MWQILDSVSQIKLKTDIELNSPSLVLFRANIWEHLAKYENKPAIGEQGQRKQSGRWRDNCRWISQPAKHIPLISKPNLAILQCSSKNNRRIKNPPHPFHASVALELGDVGVGPILGQFGPGWDKSDTI